MVIFEASIMTTASDEESAEEEFRRMAGVEFKGSDSSPNITDVTEVEDGKWAVTGTISVSGVWLLYNMGDAGDALLKENVSPKAGMDALTAHENHIHVRGDYSFPANGREEVSPEDQMGYYAVPDEVRNQASRDIEGFYGQKIPIDDIGKYGEDFVASYSGQLFVNSTVVQQAVTEAQARYSPSQEWESFSPQ